MLMSDFINEYKDYSRTFYSVNTNLSRFSILNAHINPYFKEKNVEDITYIEINEFFDYLRGLNLAQNSIFGIYSCLLSMFNYAVTIGIIHNSPMRYAENIRPANERRYYR